VQSAADVLPQEQAAAATAAAAAATEGAGALIPGYFDLASFILQVLSVSPCRLPAALLIFSPSTGLHGPLVVEVSPSLLEGLAAMSSKLLLAEGAAAAAALATAAADRWVLEAARNGGAASK
jgi:hypothetical protein